MKQKYDISNARLLPAFSLLLSVLIILANGCGKHGPHVSAVFSTNAVARETISAGDLLRELQKQNRLPGISKDDHGDIESATLPLSEGETCPISRTFLVIKDGDQTRSKYHYTFLRQSTTSQWELIKAWQTDSNSNVVKEWQTK